MGGGGGGGEKMSRRNFLFAYQCMCNDYKQLAYICIYVNVYMYIYMYMDICTCIYVLLSIKQLLGKQITLSAFTGDLYDALFLQNNLASLL